MSVSALIFIFTAATEMIPHMAVVFLHIKPAVTQSEEKRRENEFWALQDEILNPYGKSSPEPPKLSVRIHFFTVENHRYSHLNVTQTSVT